MNNQLPTDAVAVDAAIQQSILSLPSDNVRGDSDPTERSELNSLVEQSLIFMAPLAYDGLKFQCELSDGELPVAADGKLVSEVLCLVLEHTIGTLNRLSKDASRLKCVVVRTGTANEDGASVFFEINIPRHPALESLHDPVWGGGVSSNWALRHRQTYVETILEKFGGRMIVEAPQLFLRRGTTIRLDFPRSSSAPRCASIAN